MSGAVIPPQTPARLVLTAMRDYSRRWLISVLWLGLVPYAWSGLLTLTPVHRWISQSSLSGTVLDATYLFWASLIIPFEVTIALGVTRSRLTHWSTLFKALRRVPLVSSAWLLLMVPYLFGVLCGELAERASFQSHSGVLLVIGIVSMSGTLVAWLRLITWIPLVVDTDLGALEALRSAWRLGEGSAPWLCRVAAWLLPALVLGVASAAMFPRVGFLVSAALGPLLKLVWANVYDQLAGRAQPVVTPRRGPS